MRSRNAILLKPSHNHAISIYYSRYICSYVGESGDVVVKALAVLVDASCSNIRDVVKATLGEHLNPALRHIKDSRILVDPVPGDDVQPPSTHAGGVRRLSVSRRGSITSSASGKHEYQKDRKSQDGSNWSLDKHQPLSPDAVQRFAAQSSKTSSGIEALRQEARPREPAEAGAVPSVAERSRPKGALYMRSLSVMQRNGTTKPRGTMEARLAAIAKARADAAHMSHVDLEATARTDRSRTTERSPGNSSPSGQAPSEAPIYCPWRATSHDAAVAAKRSAWAHAWAERLYDEEVNPGSSRSSNLRQQPHSTATFPRAPTQSLSRGRTPSAPRTQSESRMPLGGGGDALTSPGVQRAYLGLQNQAPRASASAGRFRPDMNLKPWERSTTGHASNMRSASTGRMPEPHWWSPPEVDAPRLYKRVTLVRRRKGAASASSAGSAAPSTSPVGAASGLSKPSSTLDRPASAVPASSAVHSPPYGIRPHTSPVTTEGSWQASSSLAGENGQLSAKRDSPEAEVQVTETYAPLTMGLQAPPAIRSSLSSSRSTSRERSHSGVRFSDAPIVHTTVAPVDAPDSSSDSNEAPQPSTQNANSLHIFTAKLAAPKKGETEVTSEPSTSATTSVRFVDQPPVVSKSRGSLAKSIFKQGFDSDSEEDIDGQESQLPAASRSETMALFGKKKASSAPLAEKPAVVEVPVTVALKETLGDDDEDLDGIKGMIHKLSTNQMTPSKATYSNATKKNFDSNAKAARTEGKASLRAEAAAFTEADTQAMNLELLAETKSGNGAPYATNLIEASTVGKNQL